MTAADTAATPTAFGTVLEDVPQVTRSYSEALVNATEKTGQVDEVLDELDAIFAEVLGADTEFAAVLASPLVSPADKDRILVSVFEGRVHPTVINFLRVLNRHGRLGSLAATARAARALWDKRQNRRPVLVRTAVPLDDAQQDALREHLGRMLNATPLVKLEVDPSLIGGMVIQLDDDVYDASIRNRLEQLRQRLIEGKTHEIQSRRNHFSDSE
ncbi:ATP synthase F1 subunit delta [Singulisphaera sp. Ch08]|uniref:ATP synthase subunit delta n=1 Tax=Singulisphaera sp. Ch08 TaxID=3120278 RepID=A0AAU7C6P2_9BACT